MHGVADAARKKRHRTSSRSRISVARSARRSPAKRNRVDLRSRSARRKCLARLFRLSAGFDSGRGNYGDRNGMGACRLLGACCFILASQYRSLSCWYFCWYRQLSTMKTTSNSNCYGIRRLSARGTIQNSSANHSGRCCPLKHILAVFDADPMAVDLDRVDEVSLDRPDWN
jgi:hypothetical protein